MAKDLSRLRTSAANRHEKGAAVAEQLVAESAPNIMEGPMCVFVSKKLWEQIKANANAREIVKTHIEQTGHTLEIKGSANEYRGTIRSASGSLIEVAYGNSEQKITELLAAAIETKRAAVTGELSTVEDVTHEGLTPRQELFNSIFLDRSDIQRAAERELALR